MPTQPFIHRYILHELDHLQLGEQLGMELLELSVVGRLRRPPDDQTLLIGGRGLGDDVEVDVVDLLVCDSPVIL